MVRGNTVLNLAKAYTFCRVFFNQISITFISSIYKETGKILPAKEYQKCRAIDGCLIIVTLQDLINVKVNQSELDN